MKEIEMISQPFLTEDGFVNPACMNELNAAIADMPPDHERLASDSEWGTSKDRWTFRKEITGAFAMWACRLSPYGVPDGLENVCKYLDAALKTAPDWSVGEASPDGMAELSLCDISRILHEILMDQGIAEFDAWNRCKVGHTPDVAFTSAYDAKRDPDTDFIDLHALLRNACITIRTQRREDARFNAEFEERFAAESPEPSKQ